MDFAWVIVSVGVVAAVVVVPYSQRQNAVALWHAEAARLGLSAGHSWRRRWMAGVARGFEVAVETLERGEDRLTVLAIRGGGIPSAIELESEVRAGRRLFARPDILVGDPSFDALVRVTGVESLAIGLLGAGARKAVLRLIGSGGWLKDGKLHLERRGRDARAIESDLRLLIDIAARLPRDDTAQMLLANAKGDVPGVRLRSLEVLARDFAGSPEARQAAEAGLSAGHQGVRLLAATLVRGERGKAAVRAILQDESADEDVLAKAVRVAMAAGDPWFVEPILALVPRMDVDLAEAVAAALGRLGDARVEGALLRLLGRGAPEVKRAAATSLGQVGTVRAVEPRLDLEGG
ncbi:MAG TPA: HEAT repeat domain-containing protein, partial [Myxococcales bacterium]|nr:HEAT repeat domain-containing protein [Myxococcales bacterium]